jgi:hypothetical protein
LALVRPGGGALRTELKKSQPEFNGRKKRRAARGVLESKTTGIIILF